MAEQDFDDGHSFSAGLSIDSHDADPSSSQMPTLSASERYVPAYAASTTANTDIIPSISLLKSVERHTNNTHGHATPPFNDPR
jgi:hypothetical protein